MKNCLINFQDIDWEAPAPGVQHKAYVKDNRNYSGTLRTHLIFINIRILNLPSNPTDFPKNQYTMTSLLIPI